MEAEIQCGFSQNSTEGTVVLLRLSLLVFLQFVFIVTGFLVPDNSKYAHGDRISVAAISFTSRDRSIASLSVHKLSLWYQFKCNDDLILIYI